MKREIEKMQDIFDDRNRISDGFFYYTFWIISLIMSVGVGISLSFMKDYYFVTQSMVESGFICIGLGLGIIFYRLYFIIRDDIQNTKNLIKGSHKC